MRLQEPGAGEPMAASKLSIRDLQLSGRALFCRVDFNVPLEGGRVEDDTRIRKAIPTIRLAAAAGARLVLASHLGRPRGERREELSLRPVARRLSELAAKEVAFAADCVGPEAEQRVAALRPGEILLLENLRFHAGETANDREFARRLSLWADDYVNDAFGTAHRAHASTEGVPRELGRGAAGLLMERELEYLSRVLERPEHPVVAILGGAKIADKVDVIESFLRYVDCLLIGGGMAYLFLKAQGKGIGRSLLEEDKLEVARGILEAAREKGIEVMLPVDHVVAEVCEPGIAGRVASGDVPDVLMGLDIGPDTVELFRGKIASARTVIWNGPLGVFEIDGFEEGTMAVARAVAESGALSVVGGGDSAAAVARAEVSERISHISTGGGASLEFLAGKKLPGVEALSDREGE